MEIIRIRKLDKSIKPYIRKRGGRIELVKGHERTNLCRVSTLTEEKDMEKSVLVVTLDEMLDKAVAVKPYARTRKGRMERVGAYSREGMAAAAAKEAVKEGAAKEEGGKPDEKEEYNKLKEFAHMLNDEGKARLAELEAKHGVKKATPEDHAKLLAALKAHPGATPELIAQIKEALKIPGEVEVKSKEEAKKVLEKPKEKEEEAKPKEEAKPEAGTAKEARKLRARVKKEGVPKGPEEVPEKKEEAKETPKEEAKETPKEEVKETPKAPAAKGEDKRSRTGGDLTAEELASSLGVTLKNPIDKYRKYFTKWDGDHATGALNLEAYHSGDLSDEEKLECLIYGLGDYREQYVEKARAGDLWKDPEFTNKERTGVNDEIARSEGIRRAFIAKCRTYTNPKDRRQALHTAVGYQPKVAKLVAGAPDRFKEVFAKSEEGLKIYTIDELYKGRGPDKQKRKSRYSGLSPLKRMAALHGSIKSPLERLAAKGRNRKGYKEARAKAWAARDAGDWKTYTRIINDPKFN